MLKSFFNNKSYIKSKKNKKCFTLNRALTPIKINSKYVENTLNKKSKKDFENNELNLFNLNKKVKNSRNFNDNNNLNGLNTDFINNTANNNGNNNSFVTYIKTTMDTNMTKTKITKDNNSFMNDNNTFIYFTPSTNYQSSNLKNKNKRKRIKIPKQNESFILSKNKSKNINKTFIIPNRLNSLINVQQNILNPIKLKKKLNYKKSIILNKKVNDIKEKINQINIKRKSVDKNNIIIKKTKIKNIYRLFENRLEYITNKDKIKEDLKKEKEKLEMKIKKTKKETNKMSVNEEKIKEEIIEKKNEIIKIKNEIENIKNDKKKVNAMLVLLHKRIIDIKNRIKDHDEHNLYLDKSFFEINQIYQKLI